ncbi:MAG TPA: GEVED domain-containing protein [Edaphocola sp.]|nr:GEVED domain-containing protein [Edaphocola sp.]
MRRNSFGILFAFLFLNILGMNFISNGQGTMMPLPSHGSVYTGNVRGYWFVAPTDFTITGLRVPSEAGTGIQSIQVMKITPAPIVVFPTMGTNFNTLYYTNTGANGTILPVSIFVAAGDTIGILGQAGTSNSYSSGSSPYSTVINGQTVSLGRFINQAPLNTGAATAYSTELTGSISRVEMYYVTDTCSGTPNAGAIPATMSVCPSQNFSISPAGATASSGMTWQWQSSPPGTNTWTNVTGATAASLSVTGGITAPIDYRYIVTCTISNLSDTSGVTAVSLNSPALCLCTPIYTSGCSIGSTINSVVTTNGNININNPNSGCASASGGTLGYTDYSATHTLQAVQGTTFDINVGISNYSGYPKVWIDYNQNGVFETSEIVAESLTLISTGSSLTAQVTIPITALPGSTRMRVRTVESTSSFDACNSQTYGEVEDYNVVIIAAQNCSGTVTAGTASGPATICAGTPLALLSTGASLPATNQTANWQSAPSPTGPWTNITGAMSSNYSLATGISSATSFRYWTHCSNSNSSDTSNVITVTITPPNQCYCTPGGTGSSYYISSFSTTGASQNVSITNSSLPSGGYNNNIATDTVTQVQSSAVNWSITGAGSGLTYGYSIWVDWNQNGTFETSEKVYGSTSYQSMASGTFTVPVTALAGFTRMRVGAHYSNSSGPAPCENTQYTQYEDFTFHVVALQNCAGTVNAGTITGPNSVCPTVSFNLNASGVTLPATGLAGNWQSAPSPTGPWSNISGATSSTLTVATGISTPTSYRYWIACSFSSSSDTSNVVSLTINPPNQCYCTPPPPSYSGLYWIESVSTTGSSTNISNLLTGASATGYADYTATQTVQVSPSDSFGFTVLSQNGASPGIKIWVDWNQNGAFDANEEMYSSTAGSSSSLNTYTGFITAPATALQGTTRMRIRNYSNPTPCGLLTYGEAEDYSVQVGPPCPINPIALGADTTICANDPITLDAGTQPAGATYAWSNGASTQTISVNTAGTYSVAVSDAGGICTKYDTITIAVNPAPTVNLGADTTLCNGGPYIANAGGTANYTYLWTPGGETTNTKTITTSGTYSVKVTNSLGCSASDTINVTIGELPSVTGITTTGASPTFNFSPNNPLNVTTYLWEFGDGDTATTQNASHTYPVLGSSKAYTVCLTVSNDCGEQQVCTNVTVTGNSIKDLNLNTDVLKLYPNPTAQTVTIDNNSGFRMKNIVITNVLGQQVMKIAVKSNKQVVDVSDLISGLYQVTIEFEEGTVNRKLEVIK